LHNPLERFVRNNIRKCESFEKEFSEGRLVTICSMKFSDWNACSMLSKFHSNLSKKCAKIVDEVNVISGCFGQKQEYVLHVTERGTRTWFYVCKLNASG